MINGDPLGRKVCIKNGCANDATMCHSNMPSDESAWLCRDHFFDFHAPARDIRPVQDWRDIERDRYMLKYCINDMTREEMKEFVREKSKEIGKV